MTSRVSKLSVGMRAIRNTRLLSTLPSSSSHKTQQHADVLFYENVITEREEEQLLRDCDKRLASRKYQGSHYDAVIHDFKETEMPFKYWSKESLEVIKRLFSFALKEAGLGPHTPILPPHVIDLKAQTGVIHPHVDSLKHGGEIVASLSLLSTRTLRLTDPPKDFQVGTRLNLQDDKREKMEVEYVLRPRTFYILTKSARYDMAHEVFAGESRRASIIFRDQPNDFMPDWAKAFMMGGSSTAGSASPST